MAKVKQITVVEGPMGLKMPEATARRIEELAKGLPKDCTYRRMAKTPAETPRFDVDSQGFKNDVSLITTDDVDRDNEVVLPDGLDLTDFRKSPTVFFNHEYDKPIGRAMYVDRANNGLRAMTRYAKRPDPWDGPWLPDALHSMAQEGIATGKSIGFIPLEMRDVTDADLKARPDWEGASNIIVRAVLLEFSAAPLPANQNALALAVSKKLVDRQTLKMLGSELIEEEPKPARTVVFIPAPKTLVIPQTIIPAQRSKSMMPVAAKYAHLNFTPPKDMQKNMKDGLDRHNAGESKGHATPEVCAMAMHCGAGGDMSPKMAKACKSYHDDNAMHLSAEPGTPAHCLAMMHGGAVGKTYVTNLCKAMDAADAAQTAPGPATAVDENGGPADDKDMDGGEMDESMKGKSRRRKGDAMGAMENMNGTGGYVDPGEDDDVTPPCPTCKTNVNVEKAEMGYKCKKCGTEFKMNVNDNGSAAQVGPDGATPADGGSELPGGKNPPMKTVKCQRLNHAAVNHAAVAHATELIGAGKVSEDAWAKPKDSELDEKLCLAIDASQPKENAGRLGYPVGMNGKVYRSAVANCEARAAAEGESSIVAAAKTLMEAIQKRDKAETSKAAKAELKSMMPAILDEARATAREELLMRMGRLI